MTGRQMKYLSTIFFSIFVIAIVFLLYYKGKNIGDDIIWVPAKENGDRVIKAEVYLKNKLICSKELRLDKTRKSLEVKKEWGATINNGLGIQNLDSSDGWMRVGYSWEYIDNYFTFHFAYQKNEIKLSTSVKVPLNINEKNEIFSINKDAFIKFSIR